MNKTQQLQGELIWELLCSNYDVTNNLTYFHLGENNTDLVKTRGDDLVEKNRSFYIDYPKNSQSLEFHSHEKGRFLAQYLRKYCW